jgi:helicase MOV-10
LRPLSNNLPPIQEHRVIIISTVRSSCEFVEYACYTLAFIANLQHLNGVSFPPCTWLYRRLTLHLLTVAVTHAQALFIVVGDPDVLALDPLWCAFLKHLYLHGGWTGGNILWDPECLMDEAGGYDGAAQADRHSCAEWKN